MKSVVMITVALLLLCIAPPASAEFYRYTDSDGNVRYTDDVNQIPADQRAKAAAYEEAPPAEPPAPQVAPTENKLTESQAGTTDALLKEQKELEATGQALNNEYKQLIEEKKQIDQAKEQAVTKDLVKAYNEKTLNFNTRIENYEKRRNAYTAQVKAFNERVTAPSDTETNKED